MAKAIIGFSLSFLHMGTRTIVQFVPCCCLGACCSGLEGSVGMFINATARVHTCIESQHAVVAQLVICAELIALLNNSLLLTPVQHSLSAQCQLPLYNLVALLQNMACFQNDRLCCLMEKKWFCVECRVTWEAGACSGKSSETSCHG